MLAAAEQLDSIRSRITIVRSSLANAVNQIKAGKVVSPSAIDELYSEMDRLEAEKRRFESGPDDALPAASVSVDELAEWLNLTPRRIQQLEKKGIVFRDDRGEYRLRDSVNSYVRELQTKADGKNSKYHQERTKLMEIKRKDAEAEYLVSMGMLVNASNVRREIEKVKSEERQAILNMPKTMALRLEGMNAVEREVALSEWATQHLATVSALDVGRNGGQGSLEDHGPAAEADHQPVG